MSLHTAFRERQSTETVGIGVDLAVNCNIGCVQCYFARYPGARSYLSLEQFKQIVAASTGTFRELYLLGGEPTLNPELEQIVAHGLQHFEFVLLVTNGLWFADAQYCRRIAQPGLHLSMHRRAISKDAAELVDQLARKAGTFKRSCQAWDNVSRFWCGNVYAHINLLRPLVSGRHVHEVFIWARQHQYEPVVEMVKSGPEFVRGNQLDLTAAEVGQVYLELANIDAVQFGNSADGRIVPPTYASGCTLIETSLHIKLDGTVVPCVGVDFIGYGSAFNGGIQQALTSPLRAAIRDYRTWIVGPCRNCPLFDQCHGGCRGNAFAQTGCPRASDPYCWRHTPDLTLRSMVPATCRGCPLQLHPGCSIKV